MYTNRVTYKLMGTKLIALHALWQASVWCQRESVKEKLRQRAEQKEEGRKNERKRKQKKERETNKDSRNKTLI